MNIKLLALTPESLFPSRFQAFHRNVSNCLAIKPSDFQVSLLCDLAYAGKRTAIKHDFKFFLMCRVKDYDETPRGFGKQKRVVFGRGTPAARPYRS